MNIDINKADANRVGVLFGDLLIGSKVKTLHQAGKHDQKSHGRRGFLSSGSIKWRAHKNLDFKSINKQLYQKFGIRSVGLTESYFGEDQKALADINLLGTSLAEIYTSNPKLEVFMKTSPPLKNIFLVNKELIDEPTRNRSGILGTYSSDTRSINIASRLNHGATIFPKIGVGSYSVGNDFRSVLRHELGHYVHYTLSPSDRFKWSNLVAMEGGLGYANIKSKISTYAGINHKEAFAEMFCAYTSPLYRGGKRLPREYESFMIPIIGEKKQ